MQQQPDDAASTFAPLRPRLTRIAYRMLGSVAEAEDIVQDAYLRWHGADARRLPIRALPVEDRDAALPRPPEIRARQARDLYRRLAARTDDRSRPRVDEADDITLTLMMALERLSPLERAAFLLHDMFDQDFDRGRTDDRARSAACRQLASRAREHVRRPSRAFPCRRHRAPRPREGLLRRLAQRRTRAAAGAAGAGRHPLFGRRRQARRRAQPDLRRRQRGPLHRRRRVQEPATSSSPGARRPSTACRASSSSRTARCMHTIALEIDDGRITAIYIVRNPDKLRHVSARTMMH